MKPKSSVPKKKSTLPVAATILIALGAVAAFGISSTAVQQPSPAVIVVVFTEDDMGFTVTSTKGISNIIVQYCDLSTHKHEAEFVGTELKVFSHTESQVILRIWVKSGNNGIDGDGPPGAGQRFDNVGATCSTATTTPPVTTSTTPPETTSSTPPVTTPPAPTTQIPFFPSSAALALGTIGALGGAFLLMRRRN